MKQISMRIVWLLMISAVLIVVAIGYSFLGQFSPPGRDKPYDDALNALRAASLEGDYQAVVDSTKQILEDPKKSKEQKALAVTYSASAAYHISGDIADRIKDINALKQIAADESISADTRTVALNILADSYDGSGRDAKIFAELYKSDPWSKYLVPNDPEQSARHLYEWSYSIKPTSLAAIMIARWYSEQWIEHPGDLSPETTKAYIAKAEEYLNDADGLVQSEQANLIGYKSSSGYSLYLFWKAVLTGRLSLATKDDKYNKAYRGEFDKFIDFAKTSGNDLAKYNLFFARHIYANRLLADKDTTAASLQLTALAQEMNAIEKPSTMAYTRMIWNSVHNDQNSFNNKTINALSEASPDYAEAVKRILHSNPVSSDTLKTEGSTN